jgi:gamma-tubulin complex component 5
VFRLLLQIYRAKYILRRDSIVLRQTGNRDENDRRSNFVRQRLVWFVDIMLSYVIETVIQPSSTEMHSQMAKADDIDTMIEVHVDFITKLQTRCLLAKNLAPIHDSITSMLDLVVVYSEIQARRLGRQTARSRFASADRNRRRNTQKRNQKESDDDGSSSDERDDEDDYDADNDTPSTKNESHDVRLQKVQEQFGQALNFTIAGLKGVSRVGGEVAWEMLAERLEWGSDRMGA